MKVHWPPQSITDLLQCMIFFERENPQAVHETVRHIVSLADEKLSAHPHLGRPGRVDGTRELIVPGTPYIVPYRVKRDRIEIARVYHAARRWPSNL